MITEERGAIGGRKGGAGGSCPPERMQRRAGAATYHPDTHPDEVAQLIMTAVQAVNRRAALTA
jgi:hypothetical protein